MHGYVVTTTVVNCVVTVVVVVDVVTVVVQKHLYSVPHYLTGRYVNL